MEPNADDMLLWRCRQRWSAVAFILALLQAVLICLVGVRLVQLYYTDEIGFAVVVGFGMPYFIPLLMFMGALTLGCWIIKDHYDKKWRNRGHIE